MTVFTEPFRDLVPFMDAQRLRTPRGLAWLATLVPRPHHNLLLLALQHVFQLNATMWTEGVWEIAKARNSPTKFLLTDCPVTFYNAKAFPNSQTCMFPGDVPLEEIGTRTIFPLDLETCLIVTHVQHVRDPGANPRRSRVNARSYAQAIKHLGHIQYGRELGELEVLRINYILKRRATRYVAAVERDWLYPEAHFAVPHWSKLDDDWFLLPNLFKVPFSTGIVVGYDDRPSIVVDEYGHPKEHPHYNDKGREARELRASEKAKIEWAIKREGKSVSHIHKSLGDASYDKYMKDRLMEHRSRPPDQSRQRPKR